MNIRLSLLTLALVGIAGGAVAQTYSQAGVPMRPSYAYGNERYQAMRGDDGSYAPAITDEYGMRYNSRGDRIDARGRIMPPPVTPPGARALR